MLVEVIEAFHFRGEAQTHAPGEVIDAAEDMCARAVSAGVARPVEAKRPKKTKKKE